MTEILCRVHRDVLHVIFPKSKGNTWSECHINFLNDQKKPELVYSNPDRCRDILRVSARYEGENEFVGFNLPSSYIRKEDVTLYPYKKKYPLLKYVIAYMDGDTDTIAHEKRHAKYHIDHAYRKKVKRSWNKLRRSHPKKHMSILNDLKKKGYDKKVFIDEFQAYYPDLVNSI